jgi:soluble lytic murein transglycosylase-like protein
MPFLLIGLGILFFVSQTSDAGSILDMSKRLFNLDDVTPEEQSGGYNTDYDVVFESAAEKHKVPFALMKAHAIQESSLNPSAFMDENPKSNPDRDGWASRGLMQVLWWPGSSRFVKYGYSDSDLGFDGVRLFEPELNIDIAAQIIRDNLKACGGNVRDAINMYNSGAKESVRPAPGNYTDKVYSNYLKILGRG